MDKGKRILLAFLIIVIAVALGYWLLPGPTRIPYAQHQSELPHAVVPAQNAPEQQAVPLTPEPETQPEAAPVKRAPARDVPGTLTPMMP